MPEVAIGLMARYPQLGKVKTRLARSIDDEAALRVYKSLLFQSCKLVTSLEAAEIHRTVFVTPTGDCATFELEYTGFSSYYHQQGTDLGERMLNAFSKLLALSGVGKVILIGADCPELNATIVCEAFRLLNHYDLAIGPSTDGGYYLIGAKKVYPDLFSGINWGSNNVMKETLRVAESLGLSTGFLSELRDLDDVHDYTYFSQEELI